MLLAVDVGNTQTVIGMFERTELLQHWRLTSRGDQTADEMALVFQGLLNQVGLSFDRNVSGVVISSVVPRVTQAMREMTERYFHFAPIIVGPGVKTGRSEEHTSELQSHVKLVCRLLLEKKKRSSIALL